MQRGGGLTRRPSAHSIPAGATNAGTELEGKKRAARHPLLKQTACRAGLPEDGP